MIKIEPLFVTDYVQVRALLKHQDEPVPQESVCRTSQFFFRGLTFWQHWLPCQLHIGPSVYVAKEDGVILGFIVLRNKGKSKDCWQVDHLVIHPHHRGRGVAQELLRYAFALLGSQGVSHFIAEVADLNSAGLSLFSSCGFRRCAKVRHYSIQLSPANTLKTEIQTQFRAATSVDKHGLYLLHQEVLPPDIRVIFSLCPDDFNVSEIPGSKSEGELPALIRRKVWYWISKDIERRVITSAVKVTAHKESDFHLEFAVHPGWSHLAPDVVSFAVNELAMSNQQILISAKTYDFQPLLDDVLKDHGFVHSGDFSLLAREHWVRAKNPSKLKIDRSVAYPGIKPAINLPRT